MPEIVESAPPTWVRGRVRGRVRVRVRVRGRVTCAARRGVSYHVSGRAAASATEAAERCEADSLTKGCGEAGGNAKAKGYGESAHPLGAMGRQTARPLGEPLDATLTLTITLTLTLTHPLGEPLDAPHGVGLGHRGADVHHQVERETDEADLVRVRVRVRDRVRDRVRVRVRVEREADEADLRACTVAGWGCTVAGCVHAVAGWVNPNPSPKQSPNRGERTVAAPLSASPNPDPNPNPNPSQAYRGCAAQCHAEQEAGVEGVGVEGAGHGRRG